MKFCPGLFTSLLLAAVSSENFARAGVGVSVTPQVISNNYPGFLTLTITGLTNYQQVKVQTFLDLNGSGVIEPGDPLLDAFLIQESGVTTIGGITNINVPYDTNPATSVITATLNFAPPLALENIVGQKIYRVTGNPSGAFTPVTALAQVTNASLGQSVSGVVYSNGLAPLPNAVVVALTVTNQNYVGATVADANGHYFLTLAPGGYFLLPGLPGYFTDENLSPLVSLTSGLSVTNNLTVTNGVTAISGTIYDLVNSNTLGGVFLQAQSGSLFAIGFTDTNGNYTVGATSNNWKLKLTADLLARRGYLTLQGNSLTVSTATGSVTNAYIGLYKGNALFHGRLTISNAPVPNVSIECNDDGQLYSGKGFTDANGDYAVAALVNTNALPAGATWYCSPSAGAQIGLLNSYLFNSIQNVALSSNQAVVQNFAGLAATTTISGRLLNSQGIPLIGVGVGGSATIGGLQYQTAFVDTSTNGGFAIGATAGDWFVNANCCGKDGLQEQGYYEAGYAQVLIPPTNPVISLTVYPANLPQMGQPMRVSNSQFDFNLYGANGDNYTVQSSTNLANTNWAMLTVISNFPGSPYFIQDDQATNKVRFYRAFEGP